MALKTKEIAEKKMGGMSKTITPGNHKLKLNNLNLLRFNFMEADNGYYLVMNMETEPIANFEGFFIDPENEDKGRYEGQVGQVKTNKYFYKSATLPSGIEIDRDDEIIKQIKNICVETDCLNWLVNADGKYNTIEELVEGFNTDAPFKDKYLNVVVAGKEYMNKKQNVNWDLYLPKYVKGYNTYENVDTKTPALVPFNESKHVIRLATNDVNNFGNDTTLDSIPSDNDAPFETTVDSMPDFDL